VSVDCVPGGQVSSCCKNGCGASDPRIHRLRLRIQKPLDMTATELAQQIALRRGFNPFGDHLYRKCISHCQDGTNNGYTAAFIAFSEIGDERTIDLERLQRVLMQVGQRRIPSAE